MADEVKNGLSADPSRIASQWNRSTVADGSWLQKYTLSPLTARDYYLASAIDALGSATDDTTSALSAAISSVSSIHDEYINYLSATISGDISGYIDYVSGQVVVLSGDLKTSADILLRLIDDEHGRADAAETKINNRLDNMEAATDVIDVYGSWDDFTTNSGDLFTLSGITDNDIIKILNDKNSYPNEMFPTAQSAASGHQTYFRWINSAIPASAHIKPLDPTSGYWDFIGYVDPYYTTTEIDEYLNELSGAVADNYLSATTGAVHQGKNIVVTEDSTKPEITISTSANVEFTTVSSTNISATNITALTANGNSAKFTNLSSTNLTSNNISSTKTTATTAYITNLNGASKSDTVDNLFGLAYSGAEASAWINDNKPKIAYTADFKGTNGVVTGYGSSAFAGGISSISAKTGNSTALFTGYNVNLQAGEGVGFNYGTNLLTISADGKTYADGNYIQISGNNNSINVTTPLVNSASSGYSAYDWITTKSATLSAGPGINFNSAYQNTMGIYITAAGIGGVITAIAGSALSAGTNYEPGRCITIDEQNNINLSSDINLNEKLVIDHYNESYSDTYATANLESFKLEFSGSRETGGSFRGQSATYRIDNLKIDNYADENNLSYVKLDNEKLQLSATYKNGGYTIRDYTNIAKDYFETQKAGSPSPYYLKFDGKYVSAGTNTSTVTAAQWHDIILNATGTWVSGTSEQITIDAPYQTKFVVTAGIPGSLNANTYYII